MHKPLSGKEIQQKISEEADHKLLDWLVNGFEQFSGQLDANGSHVMVRLALTPAMMRCVLTRLGQLGITTIPAAGTPAGNLSAAAAARGIGTGAIKFQGKPVLPPVSDAPDAATA